MHWRTRGTRVGSVLPPGWSRSPLGPSGSTSNGSTWPSWSRSGARPGPRSTAARAPRSILDRVDATRSSLAKAKGEVEAQRVATLILQDRVARELTQCEEALAQIGQARRRAAGDLFVRESVPIWRPEVLDVSELR